MTIVTGNEGLNCEYFFFFLGGIVNIFLISVLLGVLCLMTFTLCIYFNI